jgi:hypothetical protein
MMRLSITGLLVLAAVSVTHAGQAGLSILRETRDGILYLDRESIEKQGSIQRVMSTQDFHRVQILDGHEYLSAKARYEVDCAAKKIRQVSLEVFPENMAMGGGTQHDRSASLVRCRRGQPRRRGLERRLR